MVKIGKVKLPSNVLLAPLSGCSDLAFRLICRECGAKFCFFEMVDANALVHNPERAGRILKSVPADQPIAGQLIGSDPQIMLKAAKQLLKLAKIKFLDINAACPAKKMAKKGSGANLLLDPPRLYRMIKLLKQELKLPITVKLRLGFFHCDRQRIVQIAKGCEKSGAAALFVHGRTRAQGYSGEVDYGAIRAIKQAVKVPVFGSGNIFSPEKAEEMMEKTGCDGILVARGAFGNPWIFREIEHYFKTGKKLKPVTMSRRLRVLKKHLRYLDRYWQHPSKIGPMRGVAIWYFRSFPGASTLRGLVGKAQSCAEIMAIIKELEGKK